MLRLARLRSGLLVLAAVVLGSGARPAHADTWCEVDPPVVITTPAGNLVVVYVDNGRPLLHLLQLLTPTWSPQ
jgi:hypothetical protein